MNTREPYERRLDRPISPAARNPISAGGLPSSPADAGEPFRPTLANAELNRLAGVRRVTEATVEQLERRLRHAEAWYRRL